MIVPIIGNVNYNITLDPTVWIFDDRKILLDEAFTKKVCKDDEENESKKTVQKFGQEKYQQKIKPPVNKSINKFEREKILKNSYVMPIKDFLNHAEVKTGAKDVTLITKNGDAKINLKELQECYLLFALKGKPLKKDGPVHLYYKDGSNRENPITGIEKIVIN